MKSFFGYPEILIFNPQTEYFDQNVKIQLFKKSHFWRYDVENWLWWKLAEGIGPIGNTQLSLTFFIKICHISRFIEKSKKTYFEKNRDFLDRKSLLEVSDLVQKENNYSPRCALTFRTNPQN